MKIGVIAEDQTDIDVLYELTCKIIHENTFSFKKFIGRGCGKLRRKCYAWAKNLLAQGCDHLIVLHDLDNNNEDELRKELEKSINDFEYQSKIILIPIKEIEAWLLTDDVSLRDVFNMKRLPKLPRNPETVGDPKKKLRDIIWTNTKRYYINTIHNKKIASSCRIKKVETCKSFRPYSKFLRALAS
jgi:hypothetical protein